MSKRAFVFFAEIGNGFGKPSQFKLEEFFKKWTMFGPSNDKRGSCVRAYSEKAFLFGPVTPFTNQELTLVRSHFTNAKRFGLGTSQK